LHILEFSFDPERDPQTDFKKINLELKAHAPQLAKKRQIVALNKIDAVTEPKKIEKLKRHIQKKGFEFIALSAVSGAGLKELVELLWREVEAQRKAKSAKQAENPH
jgi:GTP-binding protein